MLECCREQRGHFYTSSVLLSPIPSLSNFVQLSSASVKRRVQAARLSVEEAVLPSFCILPHPRCVLLPWGLGLVAPERGEGFPQLSSSPLPQCRSCLQKHTVLLLCSQSNSGKS